MAETGRCFIIDKTRVTPFAATSFQNPSLCNNFKRIPVMTAAYLPSLLVPLVGLVFPAIAMASLFVYIEKQEIV